jgi:hypothetical protein
MIDWNSLSPLVSDICGATPTSDAGALRAHPDAWRLGFEVKWDGLRAIVSTEAAPLAHRQLALFFAEPGRSTR